jgi:hypothetical protein
MQEPPTTNSYFVFFNDQSVAAAAAQCSLFPEGSVDSFNVMAAPGPEEVRAVQIVSNLSGDRVCLPCKASMIGMMPVLLPDECQGCPFIRQRWLVSKSFLMVCRCAYR